MRKTLFILFLSPLLAMCQTVTVKGKIVNEQGEPIPGATVTVKPVLSSVIDHPSSPPVIRHLSSDPQGDFSVTNLLLDDTLQITAVGYVSETVVVDPGLARYPRITVVLKRRISVLDETVIIAYGTTTRRLSTGSISRITADEIARQPVSNLLVALEGLVPGLTVTETTGLPGAAPKVLLRGRASINQGTAPLYVIDGIPFAPGNDAVQQLASVAVANGAAGLSPFNSINPLDIESIEVLKDADATAIYGSRGANGVILVTTKKGRPGRTGFTGSLASGFSRATRLPRMMNTAEYVRMRREAFANDGSVPTAATAPDLVVWDTTRSTDFADLLLGEAASFTRAQASLSGGSAATRFRLGAGYNRQGTLFPGGTHEDRGSLQFSLSQSGRLWTLTFSGGYSADVSHLPGASPVGSLNLPPNTPALYDSTGNLKWQEGGVSYTNPLAYLRYGYEAKTGNLLGNLQWNFTPFRGLTFRGTAGCNALQFDEQGTTPKAALDPASGATGSSRFASRQFRSWTVEPQAVYTRAFLGGVLEALAGGSWQENTDRRSAISATGYTNDALLQSLAGAAALSATNGYTQYRYTAVFGRLHYNLRNRYLLNVSGRRDGSSRFGPGRQFAQFGAVGAAWIFSAEKGVQKALPFLSYGKLRGSYGTAGNDAIGDYQYLDSWRAAYQPYAGMPGLTPVALFNDQYSWELNRKLEGALDLGFLHDRILVSVAFFRNRSSSQLVAYALPSQTGFYSVLRNFPALVENRGWEVSLNTQNLTESLRWTTTLNFTLHRNTLLEFPGIERSSYATTYVVGKPLNLVYGYHFTGVDPATGVFSFEDVDKDGVVGFYDRVAGGGLDPRFYGGFGNTLAWKGWQLEVFCTFAVQQGRNYLASVAAFRPGSTRVNEPVLLLSRWQKPGDEAPVQRFTASASSVAGKAWNLFGQSDGIYSDASFLRGKNLSLSYNLPASALRRLGASGCRLYVQGQNLFTLTGYEGGDPETQNLFVLPPLKTWVAGLEITF